MNSPFPRAYNLQIIYPGEDHPNVFISNVNLNENVSLTVTPDMADKRVSFRMDMPDGSPMILPVDGTEDPFNTKMVTCLQSALVNGCSQWTQSVTCSVGGKNYYKSFTLRSNFGEDTLAYWLALTYDTTFGNLGISTVKSGADITDGMIVTNDVDNYYKAEVKFEHTPLYNEKGEANEGLALATDLHRPDNAVLAGLAITVWAPHGFYVCTDLNDLDFYHTLAYVKDVDQYNKYGPKWGVNSPVMSRTDGDLMYYCSQEESKYNVSTEPSYAKAPLNPYFSFPYDVDYVMGASAPYAATLSIPSVVDDMVSYNYDVAGYFGNYGEFRQVDVYNYSESLAFNGEPVELTSYKTVNDWINSRFGTDVEPGEVAITYKDTNARFYWETADKEPLECSNLCTISYNEASEDRVPPTAQRIMIRNASDVPAYLLSPAEGRIGKIQVAGGDFTPIVNFVNMGAYSQNFTTYSYAPATLKVECAVSGSDQYAEIEMTEDAGKYVESYGAYWEGELTTDLIEGDKLYDLRVSLEDAAGNRQVQVLSPAFFVYPDTGVKGVSDETRDNITVVDGKVVSAAARGVEVYNLSGVRVDNDALAPGVYVVTSGPVRAKVIVR